MIAVDLFAGWGGFTEGAESVGVTVAYAANHWPLSVRAHAVNHPHVQHECQDLRQANFTKLPRYELLLASPACQGHSEASQPNRREKHDSDRATAWAVIDCAEATLPKAIIVENVPNFLTKWVLYPVWREALVRLGYHVSEHVVAATVFGVPQRRNRALIVATRKHIELDIPVLTKEPAFAPCMQWDAPRKWNHISMASPNARARFAKGRRNCGKRFLSQHVTGHPGVPLHEPIRTITTKDQWVIVDGDRYSSLTVRELARGMSFRDSYAWPAEATREECVKGLGNAIPPLLAAGMTKLVVDRIS